MIKPIKIIVRFVILDVRKLDKKEKGIIMIDGAVKISLIIVGLASGNAFAMSPRAGEITAPAITVAIEIEIIVGLSILLINIPSIHNIHLKVLLFFSVRPLCIYRNK